MHGVCFRHCVTGSRRYLIRPFTKAIPLPSRRYPISEVNKGNYRSLTWTLRLRLLFARAVVSREVNKGSTKRQAGKHEMTRCMHCFFSVLRYRRYNQTNQGSAYHVYVTAVYPIPLRFAFYATFVWLISRTFSTNE